ncbi:hypothetical protein L5515_004078 [Caenorhabditis briggsae]|uniref:Uncharacterized protein n=1 Tax=Caenorhabditis briggsae TaxID=6238 RepID=A0AAE9ELA4_CAEBR|nr:hypothetical protein L5515_004078 [Caenorhabditis briggsae]
MHFYWFFLINIVSLFLSSFSLIQCKSKKKFQSDNKARLVSPDTPGTPQSVKDVHRPVSQAPPAMVPVDSRAFTFNDPEGDTLANVASIKPDFSTGKPVA